jgi:hypothetical protein
VAEDGGGSGKFKALLTKKIAGIPTYAYLVVGILLLAWYLKKRAASKKTDTTATDTSGQNAAANQAFPNAGPMPWSADVFVNNTGGTPAAATNVAPLAVTVTEGTHVADWLQKMNAAYPGLGLTVERIKQLNPNVNIIAANSHGYLSATNPDRGEADPIIYGFNTGTPSAQIRIQ